MKKNVKEFAQKQSILNKKYMKIDVEIQKLKIKQSKIDAKIQECKRKQAKIEIDITKLGIKYE